ncbi:MAG: hypothetical protein J1F35_06020 [Erysipelotrichales bacterium]|nr:hypothetical protein [Erysipelotrichales bacterium]
MIDNSKEYSSNDEMEYSSSDEINNSSNDELSFLRNKKEYILCAALRRKEPKKEVLGLPNDLPYIEIGLRHFDIRDRFPGEVSMKIDDQGFLTSHGRFVSRKEAEKIAKECGQVTDMIGGILTSEDLY